MTWLTSFYSLFAAAVVGFYTCATLLGQERLTKYYFPLIVGNPLETALAISKLIFGGVLERLPGLRMCFAHGGGAFPFTLARLDHGWKVRPEGPAAIPRPPREYARRLYFDSLTLSAANLTFIVEQFGAERVVLGSDYPFDMGNLDCVARVAALALPLDVRDTVLGKRAGALLRHAA